MTSQGCLITISGSLHFIKTDINIAFTYNTEFDEHGDTEFFQKLIVDYFLLENSSNYFEGQIEPFQVPCFFRFKTSGFKFSIKKARQNE